MIQTKYKPQVFNDGILEIVRRQEVDTDGWEPRYEDVSVQKLYFKKRTVGVTRHYEALRASEEVKTIVRIPSIFIDEEDEVKLFDNIHDGTRFRILQVQELEDTYPPCMDLALGGAIGENVRRGVESDPSGVDNDWT